ncbi:unnamed protein product [Pipistrellus nathusii]|uniref:Uncharacterized protein n=1 Tax=Pipistrellus nathusii TaxID=59473 RepID=A0ABP0A072_PIPNA
MNGGHAGRGSRACAGTGESGSSEDWNQAADGCLPPCPCLAGSPWDRLSPEPEEKGEEEAEVEAGEEVKLLPSRRAAWEAGCGARSAPGPGLAAVPSTCR